MIGRKSSPHAPWCDASPPALTAVAARVLRRVLWRVHGRILCWMLRLVFVISPWAPAQAAVLRYCDAPAPLNAKQQDKLLRLAALIKAELDHSGQRLALMSRSGTDLRRFGQRYSHAGVSLQNSPNSPWSVRQLYFACDEGQPRLFDQGVPGFLLGTDDPSIGYISVLLLPPEAAAALETLALDRAQALHLLGRSYSANAYAFSTRHQNCNQWLAELMASAWGAEIQPLPVAEDKASLLRSTAPDPAQPQLQVQSQTQAQARTQARTQAQAWLQAAGYEPTVFEVGSRALMWLATAMPWVHNDDHPPEDLAQARYRVSMPASIEAFVRVRWPGTRRIEFCHTDQHLLMRHGGLPLAEGCEPGPLDRVILLN